MEENKIIIAKREDCKKSFYGSLSTLLLFTVFLVIDIIFYIQYRSTWALVIMIISSVFVFLDLIGMWFTWSLVSYSKKIKDTPLLIFDEEKKCFIINDCVFQKELEIDKEKIIDIKISDKGEAYLWYMKDTKKTSVFIGFSEKRQEALINNEVQKYKNLYC